MREMATEIECARTCSFSSDIVSRHTKSYVLFDIAYCKEYTPRKRPRV